MAEFVTTVITISIMGTVAAAATAIIKFLFSGRLSAKAGVYVWLPVILRLICPYIPKSTMSLYNYVPQSNTVYSPTAVNIIPTAGTASSEIRLLPFIWLCGAATVAVISVISHFRFVKSIVGSEDNIPGINTMLKNAKKSACLNKSIDTIICKNNVSPMIIGFVKPRLIIPQMLFEKFTHEQIEMILIHELTHYKRKHRYINLLLTVINCIHWFNPFVWLTTSFIKKEIESVCDEIAVKALREENKYIYSKTLIDLSEYFSESSSPLSVSPMASGKKTLKSRIKNIYNISKRKINIAALPVCIIIAVTLLTGATEQKATEAAETIVKEAEAYTTIVQAPAEPPMTDTEDYNGLADQAPADTESEPEANDPSDSGNLYTPAQAPYEQGEYTDANAAAAENIPSTTDVQSGTAGIQTTNQSDTRTQPSQSAITQPSPEASNEKTYTYSSGNATVSFSNDPSKSGFKTDTGELKIETTGIISSTDESMNGYFNIYRNGELIGENVRANVSANADSIKFDAAAGADDYQFDVNSKTVE